MATATWDSTKKDYSIMPVGAPTTTKPSGLIGTPDKVTIDNPAGMNIAGTAPEPYMAATATPEKYDATNAQATEWKVDSNQLVEDRVAGITDKNGLLMQQAETQGLQKAAQTGLLNSSMAVGAAQGAVLDKAVEIGSQDANTYAAAGQFNAGAKNDMSRFNADAKNQAGQFNANAGNESNRFNASSQNQASEFNATLKEQGRQFDADRISKEAIANLDADTQKWLQNSKSGAALYDTYQQSINQILNSTMDEDNKQTALYMAYETMYQGMELYGGIDSLGLSAILGAPEEGSASGTAAGATGTATGGTSVSNYKTAADRANAQNAWDDKMAQIQAAYDSAEGGRGTMAQAKATYDAAVAALGPRPE